MLHAAYWPYYTLDATGRLRDERGGHPFDANGRGGAPIQPRPFKSVSEAEDWLCSVDERGSVR